MDLRPMPWQKWRRERPPLGDDFPLGNRLMPLSSHFPSHCATACSDPFGSATPACAGELRTC